MECGRTEEQNFILEFIEVYRSLPALWNVKEKAYNDRHLKNSCYETLLQKYQERYPGARKNDVTAKINNLRTSYRRELKRIVLEKKCASDSEDIKSKLFFYDAMSFLYDCPEPEPCESRNNSIQQNEFEKEADKEPQQKRKRNDTSATDELGNKRPTKSRKTDSTDKLLTAATERLMQPKDEFRQIGETWGNELRKMDESQRIFAKKFIYDILFEGQMGTLHRNAMQLNILSRTNTPQQNIPNIRQNSAFVRVQKMTPESTASNFSQNFDTNSRNLGNSVQVSEVYLQNLDRNNSCDRNSSTQIPTESPQNMEINCTDPPPHFSIIKTSPFSPVNNSNEISQSIKTSPFSPANISNEIGVEEADTDAVQHFLRFK